MTETGNIIMVTVILIEIIKIMEIEVLIEIVKTMEIIQDLTKINKVDLIITIIDLTKIDKVEIKDLVETDHLMKKELKEISKILWLLKQLKKNQLENIIKQ